MTRTEIHTAFMLGLRGWQERKYSDGGPALKHGDRAARLRSKAARKRNRGTR